MSLDDECVVPSPANTPKCDNATVRAHRCAAQYGQYSAPTYRTSGLPSTPTSGACRPVILVGPTSPAGVPTVRSVDWLTEVTAACTDAEAGTAPVPRAAPVPSAAPVPELELVPTVRFETLGVAPDATVMATRVTTTMTTAAIGAAVHRVHQLPPFGRRGRFGRVGSCGGLELAPRRELVWL